MPHCCAFFPYAEDNNAQASVQWGNPSQAGAIQTTTPRGSRQALPKLPSTATVTCFSISGQVVSGVSGRSQCSCGARHSSTYTHIWRSPRTPLQQTSPTSTPWLHSDASAAPRALPTRASINPGSPRKREGEVSNGRCVAEAPRRQATHHLDAAFSTSRPLLSVRAVGLLGTASLWPRLWRHSRLYFQYATDRMGC